MSTPTDRDPQGLAQQVARRIEALGLVPHPEGGFFRETHRSPLVLPQAALPGHPGARVAVTSILFLLPTGARSAWHRVRSEELWLHQEGDPLRLRLARDPTDAAATAYELGPRGLLQAAVPAGQWQDAEALPGSAGYALVGCVVAPGFEFDDFELVGPGPAPSDDGRAPSDDGPAPSDATDAAPGEGADRSS